jgi:hypothetical protein
VRLHQSSPAGGADRFHTTRWSVVPSAQSQVSGCQEACAELCRLYWYPFYAFIWHPGHSPEDAQDLAQGFVLHLAERKTLSRVDRLKAKFRGSLKTLIHRLRKQYTALVREEMAGRFQIPRMLTQRFTSFAKH